MAVMAAFEVVAAAPAVETWLADPVLDVGAVEVDLRLPLVLEMDPAVEDDLDVEVAVEDSSDVDTDEYHG
ncbi:hypothetical protein H0H93_005649, partial [Arthromyces matolae]